RIQALEDEEVQKFIGEHKAPYSLLLNKTPFTVGPLDLQDYYFEHKRQEIEAMMDSKPIILRVGEEFGKKFGRTYGFFEEYRLSDADTAIVALGSTAGTARAAVDELRNNGIKVGLLKLRVVRPFPYKEIAKTLSKLKVISVMDRSDTMSTMGGPVFVEIRSALYDEETHPLMVDYIYGLGGRDISIEEIVEVGEKGEQIKRTGKVDKLIDYVGLRE
ncbi:MAG TPA: pyruvate ferredoxin oxidoreductase, partial [bacterium (Candidatus Stahlbacteria)]|nr:pyruvate ferredoxin oxidoreductase [Candidatus Stahlbacteria bacterium]